MNKTKINNGTKTNNGTNKITIQGTTYTIVNNGNGVTFEIK